MGLTRAQKIKYYKNRHLVEQIVKDYARRKQLLLFGGRAINFHVKDFLKSQTRDYDFLHKNPKKVALELEIKLDKFFEGNYFRVMRGKHLGTYKVKSNVTKKTIADITKQKKKIPYKIVNGIRVASKKHLKARIRKTLKNPEAKYRFEKEKENLQRLNLSNQNNSNSLQDFVFKGVKLSCGVAVNDFNKGKTKKNRGISLW